MIYVVVDISILYKIRSFDVCSIIFLKKTNLIYQGSLN